MIRFAGIFVVCLLVVSVVTGFARTLGERLGLQEVHNGAEMAASFLAGGLIMMIYRNPFGRKEKK